MPEQISVAINGKRLKVAAGTSVAAAVVLSGNDGFRTSVLGEPRAALCGMGICFECRVSIDGRPGIRSCQITVQDGMTVETS